MHNEAEVLEGLRRGQADGFRQFAGVPTNGVFDLEDADLMELIERGRIEGVSKRDVETFEVVRGGLTLICSTDATTRLVDIECRDLTPFLARAYLGEYDLEQDGLSLRSTAPLSKLLPRHAARFRPSVPPLDAVLGKFIPPPETTWQNYSGRHYVCDYTAEGMTCGEPLCDSAACWIMDGLCLVYLRYGGDWNDIVFYPFHTRLSADGLVRTRRFLADSTR